MLSNILFSERKEFTRENVNIHRTFSVVIVLFVRHIHITGVRITRIAQGLNISLTPFEYWLGMLLANDMIWEG